VKRVWFFAPILVFLTLLGILGWYNFHKPAEFAPRAQVGKALPERVLTDLQDGSGQSLKALAAQYDQPILVNIFASWCTPCLAEHPYLVDLQGRGVVIIGINYKDTPQAGLGYLNRHQNPYARVLSDENGDMGLDLGISGVPETFVVSKDGTVIDKISGPVLPETLEPLYQAVKAGEPIN